MTIAESARTIGQIPRRLGWLVRMRARSGLLPGQVSTAALVQARRYRWIMFALLVSLPLILVSVLLLADWRGTTKDRPATVVGVFEDTSGFADVVLDDGVVLYFEDPPPVRAGQVTLERRRGRYAIGLVVDGAYFASTKDNGTSWTGAFLIVLFEIVVVAVVMGPAVYWGRRASKEIARDLGGPLSTARGRYYGSWAWRGMTSRMSGIQRMMGPHVSGFPVALQEGSGDPSWFGAPVDLLSEIRHFEDAIARGSREVIVTYHPATRAIAKLEAVDGSAELDLQCKIDAMHPEAGLQLRVSRRPRKAHLPDF